ncbi:MAG: hypothetical protein J6X55_17810 [Victivallales bacterium]|nr:hypothetical protein [Victivallales bacterium]
MIYTLRHFDTPLVRFSAEQGAEASIRILWFDENHRELLPLDFHRQVDAERLEAWLRHRTIPRNRAYVDVILASQGLSPNRPMDVIRLSKGLSLNDCHWVTEEGFDGTFAQFNQYDNKFSRVLGEIAFTGFGSDNSSRISSSPEFTTNGMLPKCWRRQNGAVRLYKGGTEGASNTGNEPYSECYASQIAETLGFNAVSYSLARWKGRLCSVCDMFTSKDVSFIPVGRLVTKGGMTAVRTYCETLGGQFVDALNEMLVFDAVICNTDRHFGNFGFLVDSHANRIIAPAPLFDHGNSLFSLAPLDVFESLGAMRKYVRTLLPRVYDNFIDEARSVITHAQQNALRKLLDFKFKRNPRYNWEARRLAMVERMVSERVMELLD